MIYFFKFEQEMKADFFFQMNKKLTNKSVKVIRLYFFILFFDKI